MNPERQTWIGDKHIEEFYWAGSLVVYVNHFLSEMTYSEAVAHYQKEAPDA
jgi:hypothetical protein